VYTHCSIEQDVYHWRLRGECGFTRRVSGIVFQCYDAYMDIIKLKRLQKGDTVGVISPSEYIYIPEIAELGHNAENYTFPVGAKAVMDADAKYLAVDEPTVT